MGKVPAALRAHTFKKGSSKTKAKAAAGGRKSKRGPAKKKK